MIRVWARPSLPLLEPVESAIPDLADIVA